MTDEPGFRPETHSTVEGPVPLLDRLERLAKEATPGPWYPGNAGCRSDALAVTSATHNICGMFDGGHAMSPYDTIRANRDHIAACDPETILALVRVARAVGGLSHCLECGAYMTTGWGNHPTACSLGAALSDLDMEAKR